MLYAIPHEAVERATDIYILARVAGEHFGWLAIPGGVRFFLIESYDVLGRIDDATTLDVSVLELVNGTPEDTLVRIYQASEARKHG